MTVSTDTESRWLTAEQQASWRSWLSAQLLLAQIFERDLKTASDLSMAEYEVLVRLSEAPDRRLRMSELADRTLASRSRLSHQISRMEADGLVGREECLTDKRGWWATLTDRGWEVLVAAAPCHVASVRRHLVDVLTAAELATLGQLLEKISTPLRDLDQ